MSSIDERVLLINEIVDVSKELLSILEIEILSDSEITELLAYIDKREYLMNEFDNIDDDSRLSVDQSMIIKLFQMDSDIKRLLVDKMKNIELDIEANKTEKLLVAKKKVVNRKYNNYQATNEGYFIDSKK